jgi:hypothetical protein
MTQALVFAKDVNGACAYAPEFPNEKFRINLLAGSEQTVTIPDSIAKWTMAISYLAIPSIWVARNETASPVQSNAFEETDCVGNPAQLTVYANDVISFYNDGEDAIKIGISLYANA